MQSDVVQVMNSKMA